MVMSGDENAERSDITETDSSSFERAEESNIWEQPSRIKTLFRKKLGADGSQGMVAVIRCKSFVFNFAFQKFKIKICRIII